MAGDKAPSALDLMASGYFSNTNTVVPQTDDQESGEAEKPDTSKKKSPDKAEDIAAEQELDDTSEGEDEELDDDEEADEKPAKKKTDDIDWEAIAKENEEKRVSFQSEAQRERNKSKKLEQQLAELTEKVNGLQQQGANDSEIDDLLAEIDPNNMVDGQTLRSTLKKIRTLLQKGSGKAPQSKGKAPEFDRDEYDEWAASRPDYQQVNDFFSKNQQEVMQRMASVPTDNAYARYQELRVLTRDETIKNLKGQVKSLQKKQQNKKKVPKTGAGGRNEIRIERDTGHPAKTVMEYFKQQ